jgi:two-component system chemotaxis response regulator CheY
MRILVIDDTKSVHAYIDTLFEGKDEHNLTHVYRGKEGIAKLSSGETFDLVLLDWEMPELSGVETLQVIRETQKSLPVIMVTSRNAPADLMKAIKAGASEYVMKPFTAEILFEKIETVINARVA